MPAIFSLHIPNRLSNSDAKAVRRYSTGSCRNGAFYCFHGGYGKCNRCCTSAFPNFFRHAPNLMPCLVWDVGGLVEHLQPVKWHMHQNVCGRGRASRAHRRCKPLSTRLRACATPQPREARFHRSKYHRLLLPMCHPAY